MLMIMMMMTLLLLLLLMMMMVRNWHKAAPGTVCPWHRPPTSHALQGVCKEILLSRSKFGPDSFSWSITEVNYKDAVIGRGVKRSRGLFCIFRGKPY